MKFVWEWPQITWCIMTGIQLLFGVALDGDAKTGKHSLAGTMLAVAISATIAFYGGFFTEVRP